MSNTTTWMLAAILTLGGNIANATDEFETLEPVQLSIPVMEPTLGNCATTDVRPEMELISSPTLSPDAPLPMPAPTYQLTWMRTNPGVTPYKFFDDVTFAGVPLFVAGIIAKGEKKSFRQNTGDNKHTLVTKFKTRIDDYLQYSGYALATGLKLAGVESRSDWGRYLASSAMSYLIMGGLVKSIKYTSKEIRPDGSSANSWPSGHTATAFLGATILHKEYGLTRFPWFSVAGYSMATATGVMRVLNNRHWVSDVLSGAGIGIMSGELGYALSDLIFKGKGLLRGDISGEKSIIDHPSFFSLFMGVGWAARKLDFDLSNFDFDDYEDGDTNLNLKFGTSTAVGVEGAYFFNKYIGVGGRLRINSAPIKGWDNIENIARYALANSLYGEEASSTEMQEFIYGQGTPGEPGYSAPLIEEAEFSIKSDHLTEFAGDVGLYFSLPLSKRFALGSKLLVGRSIMQEVDLNAKVTGGRRDMDFNTDTEEITFNCLPEKYTSEWEYFTLGGSNTTKVGTGLSLTYAYKENYAWRIFLDYDFTRKTYTMTYDPGQFVMDALGFESNDPDDDFCETQRVKKHCNSYIIGGSLTIFF